MALLDRLQHIDRRYIFIAIALAVIVPFLTGLKLPTGAISPPTRDLFDRVESLPPRSVILIAFDYGPASMPELQPMAIALTRHAFRQNLRVLALTLNVQGVPLARDVLTRIGSETGKKEGEDWVNLGFKPGGAVVLTQMGADIQRVYSADAEGKNTAGMPVMAGIRNYDQIAVIIDLASSSTPNAWIAFAHEQFRAKVAAGVTAVMATDYYPFLQTGQLCGFMNGLKGASDYEVLLKHEDKATLGMASQSIAHALIIAFVILGNVGYLASRRKQR
jgi:hypothetical protein